MSDFYRAFEDRHHGSRELIESRLDAYIPFLAPLPAVAMPCVALDLGRGRGEWLELLGDKGFSARGVDVATGDALATLRAQPDASLALISAFHLGEHIPFDAVQELITQALRVLRPGGLLILETPNPENPVVGASNFYTDPSHLRPVPPLLPDFAVEFAGFARHKVVRLQEPAALHGATHPDYGIVAQKPAGLAISAAFDSAFATDSGLPQAELHAAQQREHALHAQLQHVTRQLNEMTVRAQTAEQKVADLFANSPSRMPGPARAAMSLLRRPLGTANVGRMIVARHTARAGRMLMPLVRRLAQHPGARALAMRTLARFPALEGRMRSIAYRALHGAPAYTPPATSAQPGQSHIGSPPDLPRSAQKVFAELQRSAPSDGQPFH